QGARLGDQIFRRGAIGRDNSAQCARLSEVADERARVDIPYHGDFVALKVRLRGFAGAPVRGNLRKVADNQPFDIRARRFLVVEIRTNISYVGISEADNLAG